MLNHPFLFGSVGILAPRPNFRLLSRDGNASTIFRVHVQYVLYKATPVSQLFFFCWTHVPPLFRPPSATQGNSKAGHMSFMWQPPPTGSVVSPRPAVGRGQPAWMKFGWVGVEQISHAQGDSGLKHETHKL